MASPRYVINNDEKYMNSLLHSPQQSHHSTLWYSHIYHFKSYQERLVKFGYPPILIDILTKLTSFIWTVQKNFIIIKMLMDQFLLICLFFSILETLRENDKLWLYAVLPIYLHIIKISMFCWTQIWWKTNLDQFMIVSVLYL